MKKYRYLMFVWILLFMVNVSSTVNDVEYILYFDSTSNNEVEIKERIVENYQKLTQNVSGTSKNVLINKNLDTFKLDETYQVQWKNNQLIIKMGDFKGSVIEGNFNQQYCVPEVEPKSWIVEFFN